MRVIKNEKFMPLISGEGTVAGYFSRLHVEVSGQAFEASRRMTVEEYDSTYPILRDFIHDSLRTDIMVAIRKKLFEGVE